MGDFRAFTATKDGDSVRREVTSLTDADLPDGDVLIDVEWSSVNYKDGLAATPGGQVAEISPLVPGIDIAGVVRDSEVDWLSPGDMVVAHGYDIGVARHGGYAERARVLSQWVVPLPAGLTTREAMVIGTAGFTAAMSVQAIERHGVLSSAGPILVTGASGGVGSMAVAMLSRQGFEVIASTGKADSHATLRALGATEVIARDELSTPNPRPLRRPLWPAAVDCVGGHTLANLLAQIKPWGIVAASGLTGGAALPTTVLPFILRGVTLAGMDSVNLPIERRRVIWGRLASDLKPTDLAGMANEITLDDLDSALSRVLAGEIAGRLVVNCGSR